MKNLLIFILTIIFPLSAIAAIPPEGLTIESVETATPEQIQDIAYALQSGKELAAQPVGDSGWVVEVLGKDYVREVEGLYQTWYLLDQLIGDYKDEGLGIADAAFFGAALDSANRDAEQKKNRVKVGQLLTALIRAHPNDQELLRAASAYRSFLSRNYMIFTQRQDFKQMYNDLGDMVFSASLGYPADIFDQYPDLLPFIRDTNLHQMVRLHGHKFGLSEAGEPYILYEGGPMPWSQIKEKVQVKKGQFVDHMYTTQGLAQGDPTTHIYVFKRDDPSKWGNRHIIEFVSYNPGGVSPHIWLRLKDDKGNIYSFGYYTDESWVQSWIHFFSPGIVPGQVYSPDPIELNIEDLDE